MEQDKGTEGRKPGNGGAASSEAREDEVSNKVFTVPNIITFCRLFLLPIFLWLEFGAHQEVAALAVFAIAASTDWVDGQVARRTHQVSKLGKLFDPTVDRLLIAVGVIAIVLLGRLPLWILVYLIARDCVLLIGGKFLLDHVGKVPPVRYLGKFATAFLMFGFCFLLLGAPTTPGLGIYGAPAWLPGFGSGDVLFGIWLIYCGLVCSVSVFVIYIREGVQYYSEWKHSQERA